MKRPLFDETFFFLYKMIYLKAKLLQKRRRKHKVKNLDPGELSFVKIVDSL